MLLSLQTIGQSLWMDHVARDIIYDGSLIRHIEDLSITGISQSSHAICQALNRSDVYDRVILKKIREGLCGEALAFDLILKDVRYAADLLRHIFDKTDGVDGWVTLPVSPLRMNDSEQLKNSINDLHSQLKRPNVLITLPGFPEYSELIEDLVFTGVPINISFICSHDQYISAAEAYIRGIERRISNGFKPAVSTFSSISISCLNRALLKKVTRETATQVTIAIARKIYRSMRVLHTSQKWERAYNAGARFLRLIWVNSDQERTTSSEHLVIKHLIAPLTVTSMSESVLNEFIDVGQVQSAMPETGDDCDQVLARSQEAGINLEQMATSLQKELVDLQVKTWIMLLDMLARRSATIIQNQT